MPDLSPELAAALLQPYAGQVRVRVGGLLLRQNSVLLAAHRGLLPDGIPFWSPPGGGWQFGESIQDCLRREFQEETGLDVTVGRFLHLHEFRRGELQALELFFEVRANGLTEAQLGLDPEHARDAQLLTKLAYFTPRQLGALDPQQLHPLLRHILSPDDVFIPQTVFDRPSR